MFEAELLDDVLAGIAEGWSSSIYGDSIFHDGCGIEIELDCPACPDCGELNPLFGLI